jgi:hypothetical protein
VIIPLCRSDRDPPGDGGSDVRLIDPWWRRVSSLLSRYGLQRLLIPVCRSVGLVSAGIWLAQLLGSASRRESAEDQALVAEVGDDLDLSAQCFDVLPDGAQLGL